MAWVNLYPVQYCRKKFTKHFIAYKKKTSLEVNQSNLSPYLICIYYLVTMLTYFFILSILCLPFFINKRELHHNNVKQNTKTNINRNCEISLNMSSLERKQNLSLAWLLNLIHKWFDKIFVISWCPTSLVFKDKNLNLMLKLNWIFSLSWHTFLYFFCSWITQPLVSN